MIPLVILALLIAVLVVGLVAAILELKEYWSMREEKMRVEEKAGPPLTVEECNNIMMNEFQRKMMPDMAGVSSIWKPVENDVIDIDRWKWDQYPILNTIQVRAEMRKKVNKMKKG